MENLYVDIGASRVNSDLFSASNTLHFLENKQQLYEFSLFDIIINFSYSCVFVVLVFFMHVISRSNKNCLISYCSLYYFCCRARHEWNTFFGYLF